MRFADGLSNRRQTPGTGCGAVLDTRPEGPRPSPLSRAPVRRGSRVDLPDSWHAGGPRYGTDSIPGNWLFGNGGVHIIQTAGLPEVTPERAGSREERCVKDGTCPKCESTDVIPNLKVVDQGGAFITGLKAVVEAAPHALLFKGRTSAELRTWVCGKCGYSELYARNPGRLLTAITPGASVPEAEPDGQ